MADFPAYAKNSAVETKPVVVTGPSDMTGATAQDRYLKQQWKDVAESDLGATHPLSINRDNSTYVTSDPYNV